MSLKEMDPKTYNAYSIPRQRKRGDKKNARVS